MDEERKKVAVYVRSATAENFGHNTVDIQLEALRKYAKENNYEVFDEYVDVASGITIERPALQKLLNDAEQKHFNIMLIYNMSRLARKISIHSDVNEKLDKLGISIYSVEDGTYPFEQLKSTCASL